MVMTNAQLAQRIDEGKVPKPDLEKIADAYAIVRTGTETGPELGSMILNHIRTITNQADPAPWPPAATTTPVVPTTPSAIKGLRIKVEGDDLVEVKWDPVPNATSYVVYRRDPGEAVFKWIGETNTPSIMDASLIDGEYAYYVVANGPGFKASSAIARTTIGKATTTTAKTATKGPTAFDRFWAGFIGKEE